jgi:hypothetical protein
LPELVLDAILDTLLAELLTEDLVDAERCKDTGVTKAEDVRATELPPGEVRLGDRILADAGDRREALVPGEVMTNS